MKKPRITAVFWAPSSEFVSSRIPSWQILTAYAQPFRGAKDLAFCLKVPLDPLLVWASSGGSGETARMRKLAWTFAARIGDKYQIRLTRPIYQGTLNTCIWIIVQTSKVYDRNVTNCNKIQRFVQNYCLNRENVRFLRHELWLMRYWEAFLQSHDPLLIYNGN